MADVGGIRDPNIQRPLASPRHARLGGRSETSETDEDIEKTEEVEGEQIEPNYEHPPRRESGGHHESEEGDPGDGEGRGEDDEEGHIDVTA